MFRRVIVVRKVIELLMRVLMPPPLVGCDEKPQPNSLLGHQVGEWAKETNLLMSHENTEFA